MIKKRSTKRQIESRSDWQSIGHLSRLPSPVSRLWRLSRLPSYFSLLTALCVLTSTRVEAQRGLEPRQLVESPTAGLLPGGSVGLDLRFFEGDGILGNL